MGWKTHAPLPPEWPGHRWSEWRCGGGVEIEVGEREKRESKREREMRDDKPISDAASHKLDDGGRNSTRVIG